jgi:hypothetical protein
MNPQSYGSIGVGRRVNQTKAGEKENVATANIAPNDNRLQTKISGPLGTNIAKVDHQ